MCTLGFRCPTFTAPFPRGTDVGFEVICEQSLRKAHIFTFVVCSRLGLGQWSSGISCYDRYEGGKREHGKCISD